MFVDFSSLTTRSASLLLLLVTMTSCGVFCSEQRATNESQSEVIVVEKSEIQQNEDGSYTVSKGWMLNRIYMEEQLEEALNACLEGEL